MNSIDADTQGHQQNLTDVASFPVFQDVTTVKGQEAMGASKDDIFIYDSTGKLAHYLPFGGNVDTNLSGPGYAELKKLVLATK